MLSSTKILKTFHHDRPAGKKTQNARTVVIWNLIRRCNLRCKHCHSTYLAIDFKDEINTEQIKATIDDLKVV